MCHYCESLEYFTIVYDYGNECEPLCITGEYGSRATLNAIYFAYPAESYYWGVNPCAS